MVRSEVMVSGGLWFVAVMVSGVVMVKVWLWLGCGYS